MALGVSPERVREVRFAEQWRGYRTDEVDDFVEQVAVAFDQLEARVRESSARAAEVERRLLERGADEELTRTLVLAQRTADAARREAQAEAARLVRDAEERARLLVEEAEAHRARVDEELESRRQAELGEVADRRAMLERDVASLVSFVEHERRRLADELRGHLAWLEQPGHLDSLSPSAAAAAAAPQALPTPPPPQVAAQSDPASEPVDLSGERPHEPAPGAEALLDAGGTDDGPDDDTFLDDVEVPWRRSDGGDATTDDDATDATNDGAGNDGAAETAAVEAPDAVARIEPRLPVEAVDDPFMAELRRAVDDPEPLGPRDERADLDAWGRDGDIYDGDKRSARFRRRRQR
ncbi:MAG: DivIVA domain-containing protein [Actinomycetota bacterium]|nr:DivIVA domain-containing protein [Actinomycetota bacterium]